MISNMIVTVDDYKKEIMSSVKGAIPNKRKKESHNPTSSGKELPSIS
jgi:hypothetical protein